MEKLADISAFERLQVSGSIDVFNGDFTKKAVVEARLQAENTPTFIYIPDEESILSRLSQVLGGNIYLSKCGVLDASSSGLGEYIRSECTDAAKAVNEWIRYVNETNIERGDDDRAFSYIPIGELIRRTDSVVARCFSGQIEDANGLAVGYRHWPTIQTKYYGRCACTLLDGLGDDFDSEDIRRLVLPLSYTYAASFATEYSHECSQMRYDPIDWTRMSDFDGHLGGDMSELVSNLRRVYITKHWGDNCPAGKNLELYDKMSPLVDWLCASSKRLIRAWYDGQITSQELWSKSRGYWDAQMA